MSLMDLHGLPLVCITDQGLKACRKGKVQDQSHDLKGMTCGNWCELTHDLAQDDQQVLPLGGNPPGASRQMHRQPGLQASPAFLPSYAGLAEEHGSIQQADRPFAALDL